MSVDLIPEDDLRAALRPYRVDADTFEAGVRERLKAAQQEQAESSLARLSPFLRSAAAFLPLQVLAGCKATTAASGPAPVGGAYKLLSYLAFPAISLFVLLGATFFSVSKIRSIQDQTGSGLSDKKAIYEATREWWRRHKWGAMAVFAATLTLMLIGATWILFLFYLISFGLLLFVLASFAKVGLGNRQVIGRSCGMGLMFLGQGAMTSGIGYQDIHFLDQILISAIFNGGVLILLPYMTGGGQLTAWRPAKMEKTPRWFWVLLAIVGLVQLLLIGAVWSMRGISLYLRILIVASLLIGALVPAAAMVFRFRARRARLPIRSRHQPWAMGFVVVLTVPLMVWMVSPILWPATPARIKHYVESFEQARFSTASWQKWEIAARWIIDSKLDPDLSKPRRLLAAEIAGKQNPYILGNAFRTGLLPASQVSQLKNYERQRRLLLAHPPGVKPSGIHLGQSDWIVRAAVLQNDLSQEERDHLEQLLLAILENLSTDQYATLETALRATQLLEVIERPIDRERFRGQIHDLLRAFHHNRGSWGLLAGGFKPYRQSWAGDLEATSYAVELMEIFGIPDDLDLNWVRSFLRPLAVKKISQDQWIAAAALARLNHLPGVTQPTWLEILYYERSLLAAVVLVGLCLYATFTSPNLETAGPAHEPAVN